jgi:hypothetical protein
MASSLFSHEKEKGLEQKEVDFAQEKRKTERTIRFLFEEYGVVRRLFAGFF